MKPEKDNTADRFLLSPRGATTEGLDSEMTSCCEEERVVFQRKKEEIVSPCCLHPLQTQNNSIEVALAAHRAGCASAAIAGNEN